tara:strand:- start:2294 stop:2635 length:342 start_codon:yes stop_codon:yes gene_type:complete
MKKIFILCITMMAISGCSDSNTTTFTDIVSAKVNASSLAAMALGGGMSHPSKWKDSHVPKSFIDGYDSEACIYWEAVQGTSSAEVDKINHSYGCLARIGIENKLVALQSVTEE